MTWPLTRLTTYAPLSQIKSADLNSMQDGTSALYKPMLLPAFDAVVGAGTWATHGVLAKRTTASVDQQLVRAMLLPEGIKFNGLAVRAAWEPDTSGAVAKALVIRVNDTGLEILTDTEVSIPDNSVTFTTYSETFDPVTIEAGWAYFAMVDVDGGSGGSPDFRVQWWKVTPSGY